MLETVPCLFVPLGKKEVRGKSRMGLIEETS